METATMPIFPKNVLLSVCKPLPFIVYMACAVRLSNTIAQSNAFASTGGRSPRRRRRSKRLQLRCVCTVSILIALLLWIGLLAVGERCLQYAALEMADVDGDRGPRPFGQALAKGDSNVLLLWMYAMAGGMAAVAYCFEVLPSQRHAMSNPSADGQTTELGSSAYFLRRPPSVAVLARLQLYYTTVATNDGGGDEPWRRNQHSVSMSHCPNGSTADTFPVRRRRRGGSGRMCQLRCKSLESIPASLFEPLTPSASTDVRPPHI